MSYVVVNPCEMYRTDNIGNIFPLPCEVFHTAGLQDGMVLKFRTFYLKIYSADALSSYEVQGYRYHEDIPVFIDIVPTNKMEDYASDFRKEDGLNWRRRHY